MALDWTIIESSFPVFREEDSPKETARKLYDYMFRLKEQMKYTLQNLDTGHWNQEALKTFKKDTTRELDEKVKEQGEELGRLDGAKAEQKDMADTQDKVTYLEGGANKTAASIKSLEEEVSRHQVDIDSLADAEQLIEWLMGEVDELSQRIERMERAVQAGEESVCIGREGVPLYLVGQVYINGVAVEEGGSV